jgi:hypothetical protein
MQCHRRKEATPKIHLHLLRASLMHKYDLGLVDSGPTDAGSTHYVTCYMTPRSVLR